MITLRQISNITGFSVSTVSKAINNSFEISLETKKYIQDIALLNNYVPNKAAISLRKRKSNIIAIIIPQVNRNIYSEVLFTIQQIASNFNYRVILYQSLFDDLIEKQCFIEINDGSVDGAIILSKNNKENYKDAKIPVEYIKVVDNINLEDINKQCKYNFNRLLKKIA